MQDLAGKRIIVGGGATGMGAALAVRLTTLGAKVIVGDRNEEGLKVLRPELEGLAGTAVPVVFDLMSDDSIAMLVQRCIDEFGGIDGLAIPAADTSVETMQADEPVLNMDSAVWERTFRINVIGHGMLMKAAIPHMVAGGGGSIVVISSEASFIGMDYVPAYSSSKAALQALVRHAARVVGKDKIRVNGVCPGLIFDPRKEGVVTREEIVGADPENCLGRHGTPDDVAKVLCFLLSEESDWITGQTISANGGKFMRD